MSKIEIKPFKKAADCLQIGELTIKNRLDNLSIFGSLDIPLDQEGLKDAKALKSILDSILAEREKTDLPEKITLAESETVANSFA